MRFRKRIVFIIFETFIPQILKILFLVLIFIDLICLYFIEYEEKENDYFTKLKF